MKHKIKLEGEVGAVKEGYCSELYLPVLMFWVFLRKTILSLQRNMKNEIAAVVFFFTRLVRKHDKLKKEAVERFAEKLTLILQEKYKNHWYPEKPSKGQAYRCIPVNKFQRVDPDVLKACENSCILYSDLGLPKELTLWVDPCEVCCRWVLELSAELITMLELILWNPLRYCLHTCIFMVRSWSSGFLRCEFCKVFFWR